MTYKVLGNTGLKVSALCLGTMNYGGKGFFSHMGNLGQQEVDEQIKTVVEAGVNFIDTANIYSVGLSETMIGKAIKNLEIKRDDLVLATKVRGNMGAGENNRGLSRKHIMQQVDESLQRLGTDYIDLYQLHTSDPLTPIEETLSTLDDLVRAGKIRYIGASNFMAWHFMKALAYSTYNQKEKFAALQANYSLDNRALEREFIPMLQDQKVGLIVYSPLSGGFLTGKYKRDGNYEAGRYATFPFPPTNAELAFNIIDVLSEMATEKQVSIPQLALAWLLQQPAVTSLIIGATKMSQLLDNLKAVDVALTQDEMKKLDDVSKLNVEYPQSVVQIMTADRAGGEDFLA